MYYFIELPTIIMSSGKYDLSNYFNNTTGRSVQKKK